MDAYRLGTSIDLAPGVVADLMQSGVLACLITSSQFIIVNEAGPVSSTIVGHFKTCLIVTLGWIYSGKPFRDGSLVGIVLAIGGIISYVHHSLV